MKIDYKYVTNISDASSHTEKHFTEATDESLSSGPPTEETIGYDASLTSTTILQTTTKVMVTADNSSKF